MIHRPVFYIDYALHKFLNLVCFTGPWRNIELSIIIIITVKANPMFPDYISQGLHVKREK